MDIKKRLESFKNSEGFFTFIVILLVFEFCLIAIAFPGAKEAVEKGLTYNMTFNRAEASEVVRETVGSLAAKPAGEFSDQHDAHVPGTETSIDQLVRRYFGSEYGMARAIMIAESGGEPTRVGDTHLKKYSYGLFQINQTWHHYSKRELLDPETNIRIAKEIRDRYGWTQWTTFRTEQYKNYL